MRSNIGRIVLTLIAASVAAQAGVVSGRVTDPQGKAVVGATVRLVLPDGSAVAETRTDDVGLYSFGDVKRRVETSLDPAGKSACATRLVVSAAGFASITRDVGSGDVQFEKVEARAERVDVTAQGEEPKVDLRNGDQHLFQQLNAGINVGQHEGGGKSLEIRRFGFQLDHGGVKGGLKVIVDDEVNIINGPFSAQYGDFSGLGVVHIRQRESLPDTFVARLEGGNFDTGRAFLAYSPEAQTVDSYVAYEGSYTDGPFLSPGRYRRDNVNANYTKTLDERQKLGFRFLFGRNNFYSSGQLPLDLVAAGVLDRFGYIDPSDGGRVRLGTVSSYYSRSFANGDTLRVDGFLGRSLFDLYSNFTYFLNDPVHGDAFQQHDSRLQEGANVQYMHAQRIGGVLSSFTSGANFHDNQINVGLYPREGRAPTRVTTRANAHVTNEAGYAQESLSFWHGRLILGGGLRYDEFRYQVQDRVNPDASGLQYGGRWQGKGNLAVTPSQRVPLTLSFNYGRGINSIDARGVVQRPDQPRLATTDFYQFGASSNHGRFGLSADVFLIDHSNEQVYIPDDGSFEFKGPSRAYGYETKASVRLTRRLSLSAGMTKIGNAYFRGGDHRVYVDSAPHFVADAALALAAWHGWSGSLRMRAVNHYRLSGDDPSIAASGLTVFDFGVSKRINRMFELNFSLDNMLNRGYYETQNYFESRVMADAPVVARIHGTPGYPLTGIVGVTVRFGGK